MIFWNLFVLGTCTLRKRRVRICWIGHWDVWVLVYRAISCDAYFYYGGRVPGLICNMYNDNSQSDKTISMMML